MAYVAKARHKFEIGRRQRFLDAETLGWDYVLERDKILKAKGLDPVADAPEYEESLIVSKKHESFEKETQEISPYASKVEELLQTRNTADVVNMFVDHYKKDDYPPMFQEFVCQDSENAEMKHLENLFEIECQRLAVDFLRRHADKVSRKALVGFAGANICDLTFNHMFQEKKKGNNNNV